MLELLRGETPNVAPRYHRPVAQTAFRPIEPGVVRSIEIPPELLADAAVQVELAVAPGTRIVDPQASFAGWLLLQGRPGEHADDLLPRALELASGAPPSADESDTAAMLVRARALLSSAPAAVGAPA